VQVNLSDEITAYLTSHCPFDTVADALPGTGVRRIHHMVFGASGEKTRAQVTKELAEYYQKKSTIPDIWNGLSSVEQEFIEVFFRYDRQIDPQVIPKLLEKHHMAPAKAIPRLRWAEPDAMTPEIPGHLTFLLILKQSLPKTQTILFFPSGTEMPEFIWNRLLPLLHPFQFVTGPEYSISLQERLVARQHAMREFLELAHGMVQNRCQSGTSILSNMHKLPKSVEWEAVCSLTGEDPTPNIPGKERHLSIRLPMVLLLYIKGLDIQNGLFVWEENASEFLLQPSHELAKAWFGEYLNSKWLHEEYYVSSPRLHSNCGEIPWGNIRRKVADLLRTMPVGPLIAYSNFSEQMELFCRNFLEQYLVSMENIMDHQINAIQYQSLTWDTQESRYIQFILSFFNVLGMIDIVYADSQCTSVAALRLTPLGAWILGIPNTFVPLPENQAKETGLVIQPDFSIILSGMRCQIQYEPYFGRFLKRISQDQFVSTYQLNFQGIVQAYELGISPTDILETLQKGSTNPVPESVIRILKSWQLKVGRIRLRNVLILETDDKLLLEEIRHIKGMDQLLEGSIENALELRPERIKRAKTLIWKDGWIITDETIPDDPKKHGRITEMESI
jgi:hypothetical protein